MILACATTTAVRREDSVLVRSITYHHGSEKKEAVKVHFDDSLFPSHLSTLRAEKVVERDLKSSYKSDTELM